MAAINIEQQPAATIPQPTPHFLTGNIAEIDPTFIASSFWRLASIYGPIFKLDLPGRSVAVLSDHELIDEACDEDRFEKVVSGPLKEVRALTGDGLFTAYGDEPVCTIHYFLYPQLMMQQNWGKAHRILMPAFGPLAIRKMFPQMMDIASQMILRLAFDTIGICAFNYRFNEFYLDQPHQFASEMAEVLVESGKRSSRPAIENRLRIWSAAHNQENIILMHSLCDKLVAERRQNPKPEINDLLNVMLNAKDPVTGEGLSDENIRYQMVTFLVAGHETTSGTLSFIFYHLLRNPEKLVAAQEEVDRIIGDNAIEEKHLQQLKYVEACIREALRFQPPITAFSREAKKPTRLGGKYEVDPSWQIVCNLKGLHLDPKIWGDDAETFRPERLLNGGWERMPRNAWKPFGNGARACIGRSFAEQEMILNVALILQRFQVELTDSSYDLRLKSTLTVKPEGFKMKVKRRPGKSILVGIPGAPTGPQSVTSIRGDDSARLLPATEPPSSQKSLLVLYGSNAGTCKGFAEELISSAGQHGFLAQVQTMDSAVENLPANQPVIIITPSYEGKPADNAKKFVSWLEANSDSSSKLSGVQYAVFGAGNSEWHATFHRVPKLVNELMTKMGGTQIVPEGLCDVRGDILGPWEDWQEKLWKGLSEGGSAMPAIKDKMQVKIYRPEHIDVLAGSEISIGIIKENRQLAVADVSSEKRHMEIELPRGMSYRTGDYLVVLPLNSQEIVQRVLKRFGFQGDDKISIQGTSKEFLKNQTPLTMYELLATRVELGTPASQRQIATLAEATPAGSQRKALERLQSDDVYKSETLKQRFSIIDLLEDAPACTIDITTYLDMLKPLVPRQYSISSSPLASTSDALDGDIDHPLVASLTYDVHCAPASWSNHGPFHGVASTHLARRPAGTRIRCFVRPTNAGFHLPADPETPIILVAAGTGLAPMRGFLQERATLAAAGARKLGPTILYFGCRDVDQDFIYKDELAAWEREGVVSVRPAFSRRGPDNGGTRKKYVYERMWDDREELAELFANRGAKIFVCGSAGKLAKSTAEVTQQIYLERHPEKTEQEAFEWLQGIKETRYVSDVFD
ncbi:MAG: hypothetical protein M1821_000119 [Bathelium mastoideum]|nr:MAG: hypothetical protein M1821_000119 [Bathelium mastoideum]